MIHSNYGYKVLSDDQRAKYLFGQCELCGLYPCEIIESHIQDNTTNASTSLFPYSYPDKNNYGCVMRSGLEHIKCGLEYVSNGIGDAFKVNLIEAYDSKKGCLYSKIEETSDKQINDMTVGAWEPTQPIFISAQTGKGKNHFIEETLLPYVRQLNHENKTNHRVLILSNRIALRLQIQDRLKSGDSFPDYEDNTVYQMSEYADVTMYQGFYDRAGYYKKEQNKSKSSYIFVICDEAHFFSSDAMFNPYTEKILSSIVKTFQNAIRVYMSATPYECLGYINECERNYTSALDGYAPRTVFYHFKRDYSYLDIKYYSQFDELNDIIKKSSDENWLVFIDNKKKCEAFREELEYIPSLKDKVYTVSKESKKDSRYRRMITQERIDVGKLDQIKVLIATSVIDNGVNFKGVQNIVISDISKVKCLQMVGRARFDGENRITLYIKRPDADQLERWISDLKKQEDAYHDYHMIELVYKMKFFSKYYNGQEKDWKNAKHWFGRDIEDPANVFPNEIARSLVNDVMVTYNNILAEMRSDETGQRYLEYQLSWFGHRYNPENDISLIHKDDGKKRIVEFLESYVDRPIFKGEDGQDNFCQLCTSIIDAAFGRQDKNSARSYKLNKLNKILAEYDIHFLIISERGAWRVVKQCDSTDD